MEIRSLVEQEKWFHCPSEENVADILSRGSTPRELAEEKRWWNGPDWMLLSEENWPRSKTPGELSNTVLKEMKASELSRMQSETSTLATLNHPAIMMGEIIDCEKYSNVHHLLRVTALVLRFVHNLKVSTGKAEKFSPGNLTAEDMENAEKTWVRSLQNERLSPWWGGFFERLIKCTKRCLKKMLGRARVTYDELLTLVVEVEAILNSRPLTYMYPDDVEEALTPSHLLTGSRLLSIPDDHVAEEIDDEDEHNALTRRERYLAKLLGHFWKRWQKEYLLNLRESHNLAVKKNKLPRICVGDVVSVEDEDRKLPRSQWRLGDRGASGEQ